MKKKILSLFSVVFLICLMGITVSASSVTVGGKTVSTVTPGNSTQTISFSYNQNDKLASDNYHTYYGVVVKINVTSAGCLSTALKTSLNSNVSSCEAQLFTDAACTKEYIYDGYDRLDTYVSDSNTHKDSTYINKAGTYYLKIYSEVSNYNISSSLSNSGTYAVRFVSSASRTLKNNTYVKAYGVDNGIYYKFTLDKSGYVTFTGAQSDGYSLTTALYNSKKKAISNTSGYLSKSEGYKATYKLSKGTYYVLVKGCASSEYAFKYTYSSGFNATANKAVTVYPANAKQNIYVKLTAAKTGYITVNASNMSGYVTLCNSKQKAVSDDVYLSSSSSYYKKAVFGVKKGQVYYLKVNSNGYAQFKYTMTGVSEKSGASASKAVAIKKGKSASGVIIAGDSTKDFYKITLSKAQKVKFTVKGNVCSGTIRIAVYSNKKCTDKYLIGSTYINQLGESFTLESRSSNGNKWSKGTYYIKFYRENTLSTGSYSIKWN